MTKLFPKTLCLLAILGISGLQASVNKTVSAENSGKVVTTTGIDIKNRNVYTVLKRYFDFQGVPLIIPPQGDLRILEYEVDAPALDHIRGVIGLDTGAGMFPRNKAFTALMNFIGENIFITLDGLHVNSLSQCAEAFEQHKNKWIFYLIKGEEDKGRIARVGETKYNHEDRYALLLESISKKTSKELTMWAAFEQAYPEEAEAVQKETAGIAKNFILCLQGF